MRHGTISSASRQIVDYWKVLVLVCGLEPGKNPFSGADLAGFTVVVGNAHEIGDAGLETTAFLTVFAHEVVDGNNCT